MFKVLDFSAIFQFALIFDHFPEMGEGEKRYLLWLRRSVESFLMRNSET